MTSDFSVNMNEYLPLRDVVFNTLRQAILKGELKPGERLMEIALAGQRSSTDWTSSASASAESTPCRRREPDWNSSRTGRSLLPISIRRVATR